MLGLGLLFVSEAVLRICSDENDSDFAVRVYDSYWMERGYGTIISADTTLTTSGASTVITTLPAARVTDMVAVTD